MLWRFKIFEVVLGAAKIWEDVGLVLWRFKMYEVVLGAVKIWKMWDWCCGDLRFTRWC